MSKANDQMPDFVANLLAIIFILLIPFTIFQTIWERPLDVLSLAISDPLILIFFISLITLFTKTWYEEKGSVLMAFIGGYVHVWIIFVSGAYTAYQFLVL